MSEFTVTHAAQLRQHYPEPFERSVLKSLPALDHHMRAFIALSPFVVIGSAGEGGADVTPRGDAPGFVRTPDDRTLLIPDWPGNNRLDTLANVVANPEVGLLFMVPGVDETLRVNGTAVVSVDPALLQRWDVGGKHPKSALVVTVREAFLHCAKALIRSKLWKGDHAIERDRLPSYAQMLRDQIPARAAENIEAAVADSYKTRLY